MDIRPANPGHVLVIPRRHASDIFEVNEDDACNVMRTVLRVARSIDEALHPDGINLIQANRPAAFQSVFHFHMHVIPRWRDDGLVPIWRHRRSQPEDLQEMADRIRSALS
jgi:histidine triad (HIT) family protein